MSSSRHPFGFYDSPGPPNHRNITAQDATQSHYVSAGNRSGTELLQQDEGARLRSKRGVSRDPNYYQMLHLNQSKLATAPIAHMYRPSPAQPDVVTSSFSSLTSLGANPQSFDTSNYPVQPYGFALHQNQRSHVESEAPPPTGLSALSLVAPGSNLASTDFQYHQTLQNPLGPWPLPFGDERSVTLQHSDRTREMRVHGIAEAHHRLNSVVESQHLYPFHESIHLLSSATVPHPGIPAHSEAATHDVAIKPNTKLAKRKRKSYGTTKAKRRQIRVARQTSKVNVQIKSPKKNDSKKSKIEPVPRATLRVGQLKGQILHDESTAMATFDSDADAEGDTDQSYDELSMTKRSVPEEPPLLAPSTTTQRLKITMRNSNGNGVDRSGLKPVTTRKVSKKARRSGTSNQLEPTQQNPQLPENLKKQYPESISDLLSLVAFETHSYNSNPQRQVEIETINKAIKKENITRGVRKRFLLLKLAKLSGPEPEPEPEPEDESLVNPTHSGSTDLKRKAEDESPIASRTIRAKARKTALIRGTPISEFVENGNDGDMEDSDHNSDVEEMRHNTENDDADSEHSDIVDHDTQAPLPPMHPLQHKHQMSTVDDHGGETPNSADADPEGQHGIIASEEQEELEATLDSMLAEPKLEKVHFVPKQMSYLLRRIANLGLDQSST